MFLTLFFLVVALLLISVLWWTVRTGISPMPTQRKVKECLLAALPELQERIIYELGSGWGTLAFALAKKYPSCQVIGFETSPVPYFISKLLLFFYQLPNLRFERQDFFREKLSNASLIVCYLFPGAMQQLATKFEEEGTQALIVSHTFALPGWQAKKILQVPDLYKTKIYIYK